MAKRQDTSLESEAAEFLVLAQLLLRRIQCFKSYTNYPGYDLIAVSESGHRSRRIQVKSRWQTNFDGFPITNFDCDFVVFVALNRGYKPPRKTSSGVSDPDYYIFPVKLIEELPKATEWGKVQKRDLPLDKYKNRWELIEQALSATNSQPTR